MKLRFFDTPKGCIISYCLLLSLFAKAQTIPEIPIASLTMTTSNPTLEDVVINCDMLDIGPDHTNIKAVAWDNGVRSIVTQASSALPQAWFWVEDGSGNTDLITLPQYSKQPDIVLAHGAELGDPPIVGVIYLLETTPGSYPVYADVWLAIYALNNVGSGSFNASFVSWEKLNIFPVFTPHGYTDGNPHIDMWSDPWNPVDGHPGLYNFAAVWCENYDYINLIPGQLYAVHGPLNGVGSGTTSLPILVNSAVAGMADVACLNDVTSGGDQIMEIVYSDNTNTYIDEYNLTGGTNANVGLLTMHTLMPRIEAMSQYDNSSGTPIKWQMAGSIWDPGNLVWQVHGYNDFTNFDHLSSSYTLLDSKSPAVAAGIGPLYNGDIGNTQYTAGFYPQDYLSPGSYPDVISRAIDVYTGGLSTDYIVNMTAVFYPWDVNRIYAVSNCSNSGRDILTAMYNGTDIVYKVSPNAMVFKKSPTPIVSTETNSSRIYPNPASDMIYLRNAENHNYQITDLIGRKVLEGKDASEIKIKSLRPGIYILDCTNGQERTTHKIIRQ